MDTPQVVLVADAPLRGRWSSEKQLQIGRIAEMNVVIDDVSISRRHAEVLLADEGWVVRDNASTNGTHLNGVRIGRTNQRVRTGDVIRVGKIDLRVELARIRPIVVRMSGGHAVQVEAHSRRTWGEAVEQLAIADDRWQVDGKAFLSLMRAGYLLAHSTSPDEQFQRVLDEAVDFFGAARGAIFLMDESTGKLEPRCASAEGRRPLGRTMSRTPAMDSRAARSG